jgi:hypothetical protein
MPSETPSQLLACAIAYSALVKMGANPKKLQLFLISY